MGGDTIENHKTSSQAVWGASPAGTSHASGHAPGTREFFEHARKARCEQELSSLMPLFAFDETRGKRVLEIGCGAGFDAYEFCRSGAEYVGADITPQNPVCTRQHLAFADLSPKLTMPADAECLPFSDDTFDIVFSNGVLHHTPDISAAFREVLRVLKPGGQFWVIVYHRDSAFYWWTLWLTEHVLLGGWRHKSFQQRLSEIEFTTSDSRPLVNVYSRKQLRILLVAAGFTVTRQRVRKLRPEDLPGMFPLRYLWRITPIAVLEWVGRICGWYIFSEAVKPDSR